MLRPTQSIERLTTTLQILQKKSSVFADERMFTEMAKIDKDVKVISEVLEYITFLETRNANKG